MTHTKSPGQLDGWQHNGRQVYHLKLVINEQSSRQLAVNREAESLDFQSQSQKQSGFEYSLESIRSLLLQHLGFSHSGEQLNAKLLTFRQLLINCNAAPLLFAKMKCIKAGIVFNVSRIIRNSPDCYKGYIQRQLLLRRQNCRSRNAFTRDVYLVSLFINASSATELLQLPFSVNIFCRSLRIFAIRD